MTRSSNVLLAAVALTALVAGCGGTPADPSAGDSSDQQKSPLAEYMGESFAGGSGMAIRISSAGGGGSTEEQLAQQRKMEDLTAACMRDAGFSYVPVPPEGDAKSTFDEAYKLPPDKFAEQYGYGISTLMLGKADADADDPNTAIRNKLSAQAKKAYDKALNGKDGGPVVIEGGGEGKARSGKAGDMGCRGKAAEQVFGKPKGGDPGQEMRKFDSLFKDLEALRKRIDADQRVTDAAKAWSDCMADARYPGLKKPDEAQQKVLQRMNALQGISPQGSPGATRPMDPKDIDPAQLAALKKYELAIAKVDYDCKQKGYTKAYTDVQFALEREFVETHKTMLEQFRDWQAQLKGDR